MHKFPNFPLSRPRVFPDFSQEFLVIIVKYLRALCTRLRRGRGEGRREAPVGRQTGPRPVSRCRHMFFHPRRKDMHASRVPGCGSGRPPGPGGGAGTGPAPPQRPLRPAGRPCGFSPARPLCAPRQGGTRPVPSPLFPSVRTRNPLFCPPPEDKKPRPVGFYLEASAFFML